MKETAKDGLVMADDNDKSKKDRKKKSPADGPLIKPWWTGLDPEKIIDNIPIMTHAKGMKNRTQVPVHESTEVIATMIRERHPDKFKITLDVYKSMMYAGRQLFEFVFLQNKDYSQSKMAKLASHMDEFVKFTYWENWLEEYLTKLNDNYISCSVQHFSGNSFDEMRATISDKIAKVKEMIPPQLHKRCDIFLEEEIDNDIVRERVKEKLRKREYRERKKNIHLIS